MGDKSYNKYTDVYKHTVTGEYFNWYDGDVKSVYYADKYDKNSRLVGDMYKEYVRVNLIKEVRKEKIDEIESKRQTTM